jgi:hypothetical protein
MGEIGNSALSANNLLPPAVRSAALHVSRINSRAVCFFRRRARFGSLHALICPGVNGSQRFSASFRPQPVMLLSPLFALRHPSF